MPRLPVRVASFTVALFLALPALHGCGGGGGGDGGGDIAPFWFYGGVVVADFDGDGRADVALAGTYVGGPPPHVGYVLVYRQSSPGVFSGPASYGVGPDPWGLSAGDFDGDGRLDLIAASSSTQRPEPNTIDNSGVVAVLLQDPAHPGTFLPARLTATGAGSTDAAFGQLTADGLADIAVADGVLVSGRALVLQQAPAAPGTTLPPTSLSAGSGNGSDDLALGDVNGDGRTDIVLAATNVVAVFYQQAGGGFSPATTLAAGLRVSGVAIADVDGDARSDIVAANAGNAPAGGSGGASVTLLRQTTPGGFVASSIAVADGARRVAVADLNGDGIPDIAAISLVYQAQAPSRVSVLLQSATSRGQLSLAGTYDGPFSGDFIAIADLNNDALNDIVVNDGPVVLLQRAAARGTFDAPRALR